MQDLAAKESAVRPQRDKGSKASDIQECWRTGNKLLHSKNFDAQVQIPRKYH